MQTLEQMWEAVRVQVPNLLGAAGILVGGWLAALLIAAIVRGALRKTTLDDRLAQWFTGRADGSFETERIAGRVVFWLAMLFVLAGFFQFVGLTVLTEPLNGFLVQLFEFAPRLGGAVLLGIIGWFVATAARIVVRRAVTQLKIQRHVQDQAALAETQAPDLGKTVGDATYWLILLLFLPAILGTLALDGLLEPVQVLVNELMSYAPNIFTAGVIAFVGWLVAKMVQRLTVSLATSLGADRLGERAGFQNALGSQSLSGLIGLVVYVLVFIPVLIGSLNALGLDAITGPASNMLDVFLSSVPALFAASLIIGLAYVVGRVVSNLVTNLLSGIGFDHILSKLGVNAGDAEADGLPSRVVGIVTLVTVLLFATIEALSVLGFNRLASLFNDFTIFGGNLLIGIVVFGFGMFFADLAARSIKGSGAANQQLLATGARVAILVLTGAMALRQVGVADEIITLAFGLSLGAIAVALAIAFGIGGRDAAAAKLAEWRAALK